MKFTPQDFLEKFSGFDPEQNLNEDAEELAKIANAKLKEWLKDAVSVTGHIGEESGHTNFDEHNAQTATHKAILVKIEEL